VTRTVVIGAGLSGLACAFDLARAGRDVLVLEAGDRPGGVVGSVEHEGFLFETGPKTVPASAEAFRRLCGDVGIADRLISSNPVVRTRFLWHRGGLRALPMGPGSFLTTQLLSVGAKLRILSEPLRRYRTLDAEGGEPSLSGFLEDRIGTEATRLLAGAFVRGVYAAELGDLGAQSAFPRLWRMATEHGGFFRGMLALRKTRQAADTPTLPGPDVSRSTLLSFPGGLAELTEALAAELGERLVTGAEVRRLERDGDTWRVTAQTSSGERGFEADRVVIATSAGTAYRLLESFESPEIPVYFLDRVTHADLVVAHLGFEPGALELPAGFGFLVPPDAGEGAPATLGTIFTSHLFTGRAPAGASSVASIYRARDLAGLDDAAVIDRAGKDLAAALGHDATPAPCTSLVTRWNNVIPRYSIGYAQRMNDLVLALAVHLPGIDLAGSFVAGVSVEEVIARGRAVARAALERAVAEVTR